MIIGKIKFIYKNRKNKPFIHYLIRHYLNLYVRRKKAISLSKSICRVNNEIVIDTYDGSFQAVHPDLIKFKGKMMLVVTPYPFGMEEYENPSIYSLEEEYVTKSIMDNPIAKQRKHKIGCHLSDPCFFCDNENLMLLYRESERVKNKERNTLYFKDLLKKENNILVSSLEEDYLSPCLLKSNNSYFLYYANKKKIGSCLMMKQLDGNDVTTVKEIVVEGCPNGFYPWHMAITYYNDLRYDQRERRLKGIFLLKGLKKDSFKLYFGESEGIGNKFTLSKEIEYSEEINKIIKIPYKSCFIPNENRIVFSFRDKEEKYRLVVLDI